MGSLRLRADKVGKRCACDQHSDVALSKKVSEREQKAHIEKGEESCYDLDLVTR